MCSYLHFPPVFSPLKGKNKVTVAKSAANENHIVPDASLANDSLKIKNHNIDLDRSYPLYLTHPKNMELCIFIPVI